MILHGLEFNAVKTADTVRQFLTYDLQRAIQCAGLNRVDLRSPQITGMPKGNPAGNTAQIHLDNVAYSELVVKCTARSIKQCSAFSNAILVHKYIDGWPDWKIAVKLQYSISRYKDLKRRALCEFADRYQKQTRDTKGIEEIDLHVYK